MASDWLPVPPTNCVLVSGQWLDTLPGPPAYCVLVADPTWTSTEASTNGVCFVYRWPVTCWTRLVSMMRSRPTRLHWRLNPSSRASPWWPTRHEGHCAATVQCWATQAQAAGSVSGADLSLLPTSSGPGCVTLLRCCLRLQHQAGTCNISVVSVAAPTSPPPPQGQIRICDIVAVLLFLPHPPPPTNTTHNNQWFPCGVVVCRRCSKQPGWTGFCSSMGSL